jgi:hypothetical protein
MDKTSIIELFKTFGAPITQDDIWQVQGATVIKHKALERLAACARIEFDKPTILRAERDEAVLLVTGCMCAADNKNGGVTRHEWSIGEALVNVNYRVTGKMAAYVYAMAEKRAKDRVILKLAGLHGIYSEDEADEFKDASQPVKSQPKQPERSNAAKVMIATIDSIETRDQVKDWIFANKAEADKLADGEAVIAHARQRYSDLPKEEVLEAVE